MTTHRHMAHVYMAEARSRHGNPKQREYVAQLVRWARIRMHRHIQEIRQ